MFYRMTKADGTRVTGEVDAEHDGAARAELFASGVVPGADIEWAVLPFPPIGSAQDVHDLAQGLLDASDQVIVRCYEHGVTPPQEWRDYRAVLRALVTAPTANAAMPAKPPYPAGT